jgi:protein subunit release factor A
MTAEDDRLLADCEVQRYTAREGGVSRDGVVRVRHIPTGIVVSCWSGKTFEESLGTAIQMLRARLAE